MNGPGSTVQRFLGEAEARGGPFAMLGIRPSAVSDDIVIQALHRQLSRVANHPESETPAADEVRLALHAAAAQLLDPNLRREMTARHGGGAPGNGGPVRATPSYASAGSAQALRSAIEHDAILVLGSFGGWNDRALHRLLSMAHARGASSSLVAQTLREMADRRGGIPSSSSAGVADRKAPPPSPRFGAGAESAREGPREEPEQQRESAAPIAPERSGSSATSDALLVGGALLLLLVIAATVVLLVFLPAGEAPGADPRADHSPMPRAATGPSIETSDPQTPTLSTQATPAPDPTPTHDWREALQAAIDGVTIDQDQALAAFREGIHRAASRWVELDEDERVVATNLTLTFVYGAGRSWEASASSVEAIADLGEPLRTPEQPMTADDVWPAAWAVGILSRLSREPDLRAAAERTVRLSLSRLVGAAPPRDTFDSGVTSGLAAITTPLVAGSFDSGGARASVKAWKRWLRAVDEGVPNEQARERLKLSALEKLLVEGAEPSESKTSFEAIQELTAAASWAERHEARSWLLRWFIDRRVSAADLHAVTSALVSRTRAAGVSPVMVISAGASERSRAQMRDTYARAWSVASAGGPEETESTWVSEAFELLAREASEDPTAVLADAVILARLNEAASLIWSGHAEPATELLVQLSAPVQSAIDAASTDARPQPFGDDRHDGAWALRYAEARANVSERMAVLRTLERARHLGPIDAEVLAREAIRGSPVDLRMEARERAIALGSNPAVVNAILEELPNLGRNRHNNGLIEKFAARPLPDIRSERWPIEARRALVERLLELLAASGDFAVLDQLSTLLARAYHRRDRGPDSMPEGVAPQDATDSGASLFAAWRHAAERAPPGSRIGLTAEDISRRRQGRLNLAQGQVQRFAAEQASLCEIMALTVSREQPAASAEVSRVLAEFSASRRRAKHVFEQIEAGERAMARLWLLRFENGS